MTIYTDFAPAERQTAELVLSQYKIFARNRLLQEVTGAMSQMLVVLNDCRQIIFANQLFLNLLGITDVNSFLGKRPGEALGCIHATKTEGGCGTTEFCKSCGAVGAILEAQHGKKSTQECQIALGKNEALELRVTATPLNIEEQDFTIFVVNDISNEKRRQILERVFFHDVLNSAGGISGLSTIIGEVEDPREMAEIAGMINRSANDLISDITLQRELSAAERGDIVINIEEVNSLTVLKVIADLYSEHDVALSKEIVLGKECSDFTVKTDPVLLKRILGNMTKNALEASRANQKVTLCCNRVNDKFVFSVHNPSYIPRETQLQLFKRSFSTKGKGRGIGTYSMKLFGENYLHGKVDFSSSPENGTTFFLELF